MLWCVQSLLDSYKNLPISARITSIMLEYYCPCTNVTKKITWATDHMNEWWYNDSNIHVDGLAQDCSNPIANALELLQACAKPSSSCTAKSLHIWRDTLHLCTASRQSLLLYSLVYYWCPPVSSDIGFPKTVSIPNTRPGTNTKPSRLWHGHVIRLNVLPRIWLFIHKKYMRNCNPLLCGCNY